MDPKQASGHLVPDHPHERFPSSAIYLHPLHHTPPFAPAERESDMQQPATDSEPEHYNLIACQRVRTAHPPDAIPQNPSTTPVMNAYKLRSARKRMGG
jgi:hypothetical protein